MKFWFAAWRNVRSLGTGRIVPTLLFVVLAASPFVYRGLPSTRSLRLTKVALLVAFSGQLQARGNDLYAAAQLAVQQANTDRHGQSLAVISALDDQGQVQAAGDQAQGIAADPGIQAVLCCSTAGTERAVAAQLPARETLLSLSTATTSMPGSEALLARRQFGTGPVVILSDQTSAEDVHAGALQPAFQSVGDAVTLLSVDFANGSRPGQVATAVAQQAPSLVVLDMDYPAAAALGAAIRTAGVTAPLLGDDRLDGATAAALLGSAGQVWYVAVDREALLKQAPVTYAPAFQQMRGHQASARAILAYLQTRAALHDGVAPIQLNRLPLMLYQMTPGAYPGRAVATTGDGGS